MHLEIDSSERLQDGSLQIVASEGQSTSWFRGSAYVRIRRFKVGTADLLAQSKIRGLQEYVIKLANICLHRCVRANRKAPAANRCGALCFGTWLICCRSFSTISGISDYRYFHQCHNGSNYSGASRAISPRIMTAP
jgi:hypothetical protein